MQTIIFKSTITKGIVIALISAMILSTTGVIISHLTIVYHVPPIIIALWRNIILVLVLGVILELFYPFLIEVRKKDLFYFVRFGFLLSIFNLSWTTSVALNGAGVATVLVCLSAIFTVFLAKVILGEYLGGIKIVSAILALVGTVLISGSYGTGTWTGSFVGITCGVFSGLCYSCYTLMGKISVARKLNPWTVIFYSFFFATIFIVIYMVVAAVLFQDVSKINPLFLGNQLKGWGYIFLLAVGPTLIGFGLFNLSLSYLQASVTNVILTSEPVFTIILAYYLLGERLHDIQLLGSALIIMAVVMVGWYEKQKTSKSQSYDQVKLLSTSKKGWEEMVPIPVQTE